MCVYLGVPLARRCDSGIGFAIARKLGEAPNHVCILASRDPDRGQKAVEQLEAEGVKTLFKQLDINDPGSVEVRWGSSHRAFLVTGGLFPQLLGFATALHKG